MRKAIKNLYRKTKLFLDHHSPKIFLFLFVVLLTLISFGLGYITAKSQEKTLLQGIKGDISPQDVTIVEFISPF